MVWPLLSRWRWRDCRLSSSAVTSRMSAAPAAKQPRNHRHRHRMTVVGSNLKIVEFGNGDGERSTRACPNAGRTGESRMTAKQNQISAEPCTAEQTRLNEANEDARRGGAGARTSANAPGARCVRTIRRTGEAWNYFPHDHARSRAYRWSEDGLAGISDEHQRICFALALWNGRDPILKERAFGLTGTQGNHGEDLKEYYYYLDSTPTHSYMKYLYKYPQARISVCRFDCRKRAAQQARTRIRID